MDIPWSLYCYVCQVHLKIFLNFCDFKLNHVCIYLAIETQDEQHHEEKYGPQLRHGESQERLWVCNECQPRTLLDHMVHRHAKIMRHRAQDAECHYARDHAGNGVHHADNQRVPATIDRDR